MNNIEKMIKEENIQLQWWIRFEKGEGKNREIRNGAKFLMGVYGV